MRKTRRRTREAKDTVAKHSVAGRNGVVRKAPPGTVVIRPGAKPSRRGQEAVDTLSAGVQDALKRLASRRIAAVVRENDDLIVAIPRKVGGRYVVQAPKETEKGRERTRHSRTSNKRP